ncbi:MAG: response regulator transcription factor [Steroidobacteraceae bacterium]
MSLEVFVVDDHAIVRDGLLQLLRTHTGFDPVGSASNGVEAIEKVRQLRPRVVILDVALPDIDGIQVATRIHSELPEVAIVMLSMHASADFMIRALEAGALGYVLKESASEEIIDAVNAAASGQRFLSAKAAAILAEGLATRRDAPTPRNLSRREREILRLVADGLTSIAIGEKLSLSQKTVDTYRSRLMHKLNINSVAGLTKFALQHGLTTLQ